MVDELARVEAELAPTDALRKRREKLREDIQKWFKDAPADQPYLLKRPTCNVEVSMRQNQRVVDMPKLFRRLKDQFWPLCKGVLVEQIDKLLPGPAQKEFVSEVRTGPRSISVQRKF